MGPECHDSAAVVRDRRRGRPLLASLGLGIDRVSRVVVGETERGSHGISSNYLVANVTSLFSVVK